MDNARLKEEDIALLCKSLEKEGLIRRIDLNTYALTRKGREEVNNALLSLPVCPFDTTPDEVARGMLEIAEVKPDDIVYDLGSGDGRIPIIAAKEFGATAYGVEIRKDLVKVAKNRARNLKPDSRVKIIHGDIFKADISRADAVFLYLTEGINIMLRPKLERELKLGAHIVSHNYPIRGWVPKKIKIIRGHVLYLYTKEK